MHMKQNERGFTLVELVVAVALLSGVMAALYYFFAFSMRSFHFTEDYYEAELSARNSIREMSKEIRKAQKVTIGVTEYKAVKLEPDGMTMSIYTDIDNDSTLELVMYTIDKDEHKLFKGTAELGDMPSVWTEMADKIYNGEDPAIPAFKANNKRVEINLLIGDNSGSLKEAPISVVTSITVRGKGAME